MPLTLTVPFAVLVQAAAILARVSGLMILAPVFSTRPMPRPLQMVLSLALTAALWPAAAASAVDPARIAANPVGCIIAEVALGTAMGLVADFLFAAVDLASSVLSFGTGMSYINAVDPNTPVRSTVLATFQWLLVSGLFLAANGHQVLLRAVALSFAVVPAGEVAPAELWRALAPASAGIFAFGVVLAAPALMVLLLVDLALGLIGRVMPQVQVLMIGMGIKPVAGLLAMSIAYAALPRAIALHVDRAVLDLGRVVRSAAP